MLTVAQADHDWSGMLERACRDRSVTPVFQPIVDLVRGVVCGYEGLARIQEPSSSANVEEWFAAAARYGYGPQLEAVALEVILAERRDMPANCFLSVNASPDALMSDDVWTVLADHGDLNGVVLEVTEQTPVQDYPALLDRLEQLRDRGAVFAVDDTGAGYASIRHLLILHPEIVKLDRSLVSGIDQDPSRVAAVSALGAFAGAMDAWVIAEGVECRSELERLIGLDVPLVQGHYLGRPGRDMVGLSSSLGHDVRSRQAERRTNVLGSLARPALTMTDDPETLAETAVLVDEHRRPISVFVPGGGRRAERHAAMRVQITEDLPEVALRAVARRSEDRFTPICLCDELGRFVGLIGIDTLLEEFATGSRSITASPRAPIG